MVDFEQLKELKERKEPFAVATVIRSEGSSPSKIGSSMIVFADGKSRGTVGGGEVEKDAIEQAKLLIKKGKSATVSFNLGGGKRGSDFVTEMVCGGNVEIFFDVWKPPLRLVVFGAGHIGKKLAEISKVLKWDCVAVDNRKEFAEEIRKAGAESFCLPYSEAFGKVDIDENSAIVIVTHGHAYDAECLEGALKSKAFYIGMIGSKTKVKLTFDKISRKGIKIDKRVYSPVGLDLGGESPEEIAMAIAAEVMKIKNGGNARHLRVSTENAVGEGGTKNADL